jgi:glycine/D-amino acid oxidase-like deaminating enzyme
LDLTDTADVLVIGGGVFGLSVARSCASAGLSVILTEAKRIGAGASGGLVGALVPHRPGHWRGFEQFQFDALAELPTRMAALARASGCDPGYARTGRLSPLADAGQRARAEAQVVAAREHWAGDARLTVLEGLPEPLSGWLAQASFPFGLVHETLSARVAPRRYLAALKAALAGRVEIREGWHCTGLDPAGGAARFAQGEIAAGHVVLAAGTGAIPLLERLMARPCGSGVKGQAALLDIAAPPGWGCRSFRAKGCILSPTIRAGWRSARPAKRPGTGPGRMRVWRR